MQTWNLSQKRLLVFASVVLLLGIVCTVLIVTLTNPRNNWQNYTATQLVIEQKIYYLWIADTPVKHYQGLSDITEKNQLQGKAGMVFEFSNEEIRTFVNRKTYVDLEVVWMRGEKVVGRSDLWKVRQNKDIGDQWVTSLEPVDRVVELVK